MERETPAFRKLFSVDLNIRSAIMMIIGPLLFQGVAYLGFENQFFPPLVAVLAGLIVIGLVWLIFRYNLIRSTFRDGMTVKARVTDTETIITRSKKGGRRRSHYAKLAYAVNGENFEQRLRLPGDPAFYGISEGGDVELILREEKPKTIFIKHMYLN